MAEQTVDEALVEKAARVVTDVFSAINLRHPDYARIVARAVLAAVLPDVRREHAASDGEGSR